MCLAVCYYSGKSDLLLLSGFRFIFRLLVGTDYINHLSLEKDDSMLLGRRITQKHFFLQAQRFDFSNGAFKEVRLVSTVAEI